MTESIRTEGYAFLGKEFSLISRRSPRTSRRTKATMTDTLHEASPSTGAKEIADAMGVDFGFDRHPVTVTDADGAVDRRGSIDDGHMKDFLEVST